LTIFYSNLSIECSDGPALSDVQDTSYKVVAWQIGEHPIAILDTPLSYGPKVFHAFINLPNGKFRWTLVDPFSLKFKPMNSETTEFTAEECREMVLTPLKYEWKQHRLEEDAKFRAREKRRQQKQTLKAMVAP
jgi:hypothetical protein